MQVDIGVVIVVGDAGGQEFAATEQDIVRGLVHHRACILSLTASNCAVATTPPAREITDLAWLHER